MAASYLAHCGIQDYIKIYAFALDRQRRAAGAPISVRLAIMNEHSGVC